MKTVRLIRSPSTDEGTFGIWLMDGLVLQSLELPNRNNKPNLSCVPTGTYEVSIRYSPHFKKKLYWLKDVKGRSFILVHGATFAGDVELGYQSHLQGCIALGKSKGSALNKFQKRQRCIFGSQQAVREMMDYLNGEPFKLIIEDKSC